jgi:hypothetical protein
LEQEEDDYDKKSVVYYGDRGRELFHERTQWVSRQRKILATSKSTAQKAPPRVFFSDRHKWGDELLPPKSPSRIQGASRVKGGTASSYFDSHSQQGISSADIRPSTTGGNVSFAQSSSQSQSSSLSLSSSTSAFSAVQVPVRAAMPTAASKLPPILNAGPTKKKPGNSVTIFEESSEYSDSDRSRNRSNHNSKQSTTFAAAVVSTDNRKQIIPKSKGPESAFIGVSKLASAHVTQSGSVSDIQNESDDFIYSGSVTSAFGGKTGATKSGRGHFSQLEGDADDVDSDCGSIDDLASRLEQDDYTHTDELIGEPVTPRTKFIAACMSEGINPRASLIVRKENASHLHLSYLTLGDKVVNLLSEAVADLPDVESIEVADNKLTGNSQV